MRFGDRYISKMGHLRKLNSLLGRVEVPLHDNKACDRVLDPFLCALCATAVRTPRSPTKGLSSITLRASIPPLNMWWAATSIRSGKTQCVCSLLGVMKELRQEPSAAKTLSTLANESVPLNSIGKGTFLHGLDFSNVFEARGCVRLRGALEPGASNHCHELLNFRWRPQRVQHFVRMRVRVAAGMAHVRGRCAIPMPSNSHKDKTCSQQHSHVVLPYLDSFCAYKANADSSGTTVTPALEQLRKPFKNFAFCWA